MAHCAELDGMPEVFRYLVGNIYSFFQTTRSETMLERTAKDGGWRMEDDEDDAGCEWNTPSDAQANTPLGPAEKRPTMSSPLKDALVISP